MGDPKKQHRHYDSVKLPWDKDRIIAEKKLVQKYGIRRKKELRKAETVLRNFRQRARKLIGSRNEMEEATLLKKVSDLGLADKNATLDTVLTLKLETVLERRLQTMLMKKELANTPLQARQFIAHGHVEVDGVKVISPSYMVNIYEENKIGYVNKSSLKSTFTLAKKDEEKEKETKKPEQRRGRRDDRKGGFGRNSDKRSEKTTKKAD